MALLVNATELGSLGCCQKSNEMLTSMDIGYTRCHFAACTLPEGRSVGNICKSRKRSINDNSHWKGTKLEGTKSPVIDSPTSER
jgi:hypothetical protein